VDWSEPAPPKAVRHSGAGIETEKATSLFGSDLAASAFEHLTPSLKSDALASQPFDTGEKHSRPDPIPLASGGTGIDTLIPIASGLSDVLIDGSGSIVGVGAAPPSSSYTTGDFFATRYLTSGALDSTFNGSGYVTTSFSHYADGANSAVIQPDGKIVAAGSTVTRVNSSGFPTYEGFALDRYNSDASLDTTFGASHGHNRSGMQTTYFGSSSVAGVGQVLLQPDGKLLAVGGANSKIGLARYTSSGDLDTTFGNGGTAVVNLSDGYPSATPRGAALLSNGQFLVAGAIGELTGGAFVLARFNSNGSLDTSFGSNGYVTQQFGWANAEASAIVVQGNGQIVLAGFVDNETSPYTYGVALARFNADGSLDSSFGSGGYVITTATSIINGDNISFTTGAVLQPTDGSIVVVGWANQQGSPSSASAFVCRYTTAGALDTSFNTSGIVTFQVNGWTRADGVTIQSDGKIVVAGQANNTSSTRVAMIARLNPDGTFDSSL
jgi:uncharacterized delta-60 repeat protein